MMSGDRESFFGWLVANASDQIIEPWFKYLEWLSILAVLSAAAQLSQSRALVVVVFISNTLLALWLCDKTGDAMLHFLQAAGRRRANLFSFETLLQMFVFLGLILGTYAFSNYISSLIVPLVAKATAG